MVSFRCFPFINLLFIVAQHYQICTFFLAAIPSCISTVPFCFS